jgi:hypothetical protein
MLLSPLASLLQLPLLFLALQLVLLTALLLLLPQSLHGTGSVP